MAETPQAAAPAKPSKLLPILLIMNSALIAGVLAVLLLRPAGGASAAHADKDKPAAHGEPAKGEHGEAKPAHGGGGEHGGGEHGALAEGQMGPTVKLPDFVIHLRDTEADRYARLSFEVEVSSEKDKTDVGNRLAVIRDVFISYLSDRTLEELRGSEGLAHTKDALLKKLAVAAPNASVRGLYVMDLVMQ